MTLLWERLWVSAWPERLELYFAHAGVLYSTPKAWEKGTWCGKLGWMRQKPHWDCPKWSETALFDSACALNEGSLVQERTVWRRMVTDIECCPRGSEQRWGGTHDSAATGDAQNSKSHYWHSCTAHVVDILPVNAVCPWLFYCAAWSDHMSFLMAWMGFGVLILSWSAGEQPAMGCSCCVSSAILSTCPDHWSHRC